jgi:hypothetical protein
MGDNIGNGWTKHMSRSQNRPYLYHHQQNKRYWTEVDLPKGWCFDWENEKKLYRNVLTGVTQSTRPSTTAPTTTNASKPNPTERHATTTTTTTAPPAAPLTSSLSSSSSSSASQPSQPNATTTGTTGTTTTNNDNTEQPNESQDHHPLKQEQQPEEQEDYEDYEEEEDKRLGFPENKPDVTPYSHGWCFKPQKFGLRQVLNEDTMCVVELGSYLGNSAKVIAEYAPNAQIYCVDRWDYNYIATKQKDQYQEYELKIMKEHPLYETFLVNTWHLKEHSVDEEGNCAGVVPMRMDTVEALQYLSEGGAYPDVIYIDGDHSTEQVRKDLLAALEYFPDAIILGNDYRNVTVQRAVDGVADEASKKMATKEENHQEKEVGDGSQTEEFSTTNKLPVYTDSYSMIWILNRQLDEGNYTDAVKLVEDDSEDIMKHYRKLQNMISKGCTKQEMAYEFIHTDRKKFIPYLNHCAKKNKGRTILMHAAAEGHTSVVELLVDPCGSFRVDVNVQGNQNDYTALHYAAYNGHAKCVQVLLQAGARCTLVNKYDETPAQSAHSRGHKYIEVGIQRWLESNPETKRSSSGSSALKDQTKKGHGLAKTGSGGGKSRGGGSSSSNSNSSSSSSSHSHSSSNSSSSSSSSKKSNNDTLNSGAAVLTTKLNDATTQINIALKKTNQKNFDSGAKKTLKRLLKALHKCTDAMNSEVATSTGIIRVVEKLAEQHKDEKVQKWANGLVEVWQEKIKSNLGKVEETVSSGKRKSSEVDDSDGKDQGAFKPTKKKARK